MCCYKPSPVELYSKCPGSHVNAALLLEFTGWGTSLVVPNTFSSAGTLPWLAALPNWFYHPKVSKGDLQFPWESCTPVFLRKLPLTCCFLSFPILLASLPHLAWPLSKALGWRWGVGIWMCRREREALGRRRGESLVLRLPAQVLQGVVSTESQPSQEHTE
jgi:hypothetical protein